MSSTFTDILRLEKQGDGENDSTWGQKANEVFEMIEDAIAGRATVSMPSDANYTLTTNNSAADEARMAMLNIASAGSLTATRDIIVPTKSKLYIVKNATTGAQSIRVKTSGGTGITIPNGKTTFVCCDGTNVVSGVDWLPAIAFDSLPIIDAKGDLIYGSAADTPAVLANGIEMIGAVPGGRLTLTSGTPVTTGDVTGATTVYYTPHQGNIVSLYDGDTWIPYIFSELSQATSDTTKSPAAVANNSNYDIFVWNDSGTLRATRGPLWTSDTARGTGAGTTELELFEGRYVNKVAITNGPAARRGLYVGTIRSDGSAQINDSLLKRHVWNTYNRRERAMRAIEGTSSWTYTTAAFRQANNSAANQLDFVRGLNEDVVQARAIGAASNSATLIVITTGIGLDSTTALAAGALVGFAALDGIGQVLTTEASYDDLPGIGRHYLAWLEYSQASGTTTWYGDNGGTQIQQGISGRMLA